MIAGLALLLVNASAAAIAISAGEYWLLPLNVGGAILSVLLVVGDR